ncbi:efflux RND transporter periplasmic adaptor subunit [Paenibacillus sp. UMB4589-SE434]|uniref:efflux RND transporter periplasmic adaptor subunit n=1 Tax=Paenibacillus sp. UMB4589-SE434 TaxID=3046314 RepID=UPI00254FEEF4|nr:efflux RND transporter periplasmic adaptor subunit [Paenibacillus sp. UMB4589-SE434]MDK8182842.1 efflux RND transporter periplasmic adaptor subunit [Paenibacillus sp. UMB4589-SE434]
MRSKIKLIGTAAVLITVCVATYLWVNKPKEAQSAPVPTAQVTKGDIVVNVSGAGTVSPRYSATVKPQQSGELESVTFKSGDVVKKGQLLASYKSEDFSSQIAKQKLQLQKQEMELAQLKTKYIEADEQSRGAVANQIESMKLDMALSNQGLQDLQDKQAKKVTITSPMAGTITSTDISSGMQVSGNTVVAEVVDYTQLKAVIQIDELDIPKVKLNQKTELTFEALPDKKLEGTVIDIANEGTASGGVAVFDVTIGFHSTVGVKSGMSVQASIEVNKKQNILTVPIEAVSQINGKSYVMVASGANETGSQAGSGMKGKNGDEKSSAGVGLEDGNGERDIDMPDGKGGSQRLEQSKGEREEGFVGEGGNTSTSRGEADGKRARNMSDEERAAFRDRMQAAGGRQLASAGSGAASGALVATAGTRTEVTVGINNETYMEIVSGVKEGNTVILPAVKASSASSTNQFNGMGGLGGFGGMSGGMGGSFSGNQRQSGVQRQSGGNSGGGGGR